VPSPSAIDKMKIGFDALIYAWPPGGIATYQTQLMAALARLDGIDIVLSGGVASDPLVAQDLGLTPATVKQRHLLFAWNMLAAGGTQSDVHHLTGFWRPPFLRAGKIVMTVHDMIPERWGRTYPQIARVHYAKQRVAARADAIICPSASVADDVAGITGRDRRDIHVVPHGAPDATIAEQPGNWFAAHPGTYLLIVGRRTHYKNFTRVLPALARVLSARPDLTLICIGGGPFDGDETAAIKKAGLTGRVRQQGLSAADLAAAYRHAAAVIAPSRAEGFGFPVLEAMAFGAPVVASAIPTQVEIAADTVQWFDAEQPDTLTPALTALLDDTAAREARRAAALARAALFTWDRTARETRDIYLAIAARP
jgi:glycosyltransferase involved in cell wall biosynthesis